MKLFYRCAYGNTPKFHQVKGKGKIVSKKWIEECFTQQKKLSWRRYALESNEKNQPESEDEIYCEWLKPKSSSSSSSLGDVATAVKNVQDSDDDAADMAIVVCRQQSSSPAKLIIDDSDTEADMKALTTTKHENLIDVDEGKKEEENNNAKMVVTEMEEVEEIYPDDSDSSIDITTIESKIFKDKIFYLNKDLSEIEVIGLKDKIKHMMGTITKNPTTAHYIITKMGRSLPSSKSVSAVVVKNIWINECHELSSFIPTKRYVID